MAPQASSLPTGTVTLLFTDIAGSTRHWEEQRQAMADALARHDDLMRAAVAANGGHVFKAVGDAFCAVFWRPSDGVAAAIAAQRALQAEDWSSVGGLQVRMALHSGATEERQGDYFGPAVNRVARLLAVGHGGQVITSAVTAQLLHGMMPEKAELLDLGEHRLKDLADTERIWQLVAPGLSEKFPALRSLESLPNNLPRQRTALIGRADVVRELKALTAASSVVTLLGAGGIGKTRLALQVGADLLDTFSDGVWFVELAPLRDPAFSANPILSALGVAEHGEHSALETLLRYLARKRLLLILDNCEHLIEEMARIADSILRDCPEVRLLATSREPLRIDGERVYSTPSLGVPSQNDALTTADVREYGAVELFVRRAEGADPKFRLTDENAAAVAEICRRLDGIALAIELAAARVNVLSPRQLAQRLNERLSVLTGGSRTAMPRHQTMRALIEWSYDLLSLKEQRFFGKLSIFGGGWALEAVGEVCIDDGDIIETCIQSSEALDLMTSLVDKSLAQAELFGSGTRYRLLESTREYARERLTEFREYETTARAHARAYLALARRIDDMQETNPRRVAHELIEPELENWRAAVDWALRKRGDVVLGQYLVATLGYGSWWLLPASEWLRWLGAAREAADDSTPPDIRARLDLAEASRNTALYQFKEAQAAAERALGQYRSLDDPLGIARAQQLAGNALVILGKIEEGEALLRTALGGFQELGAHRGVAFALICLASARGRAGDVVAARALCAEAVANSNAIDGEHAAPEYKGFLAELEFRMGDPEAALRVAAEALEAFRELNARDHAVQALCNMAAYSIALDRFTEAKAQAREALALAAREEHGAFLAVALQHLAAIAALQRGDGTIDVHARAVAASLVGFVDARFDALASPREYTERQEYDRMIAALQKEIGDDALRASMAQGRTWTEERAVAAGFAV